MPPSTIIASIDHHVKRTLHHKQQNQTSYHQLPNGRYNNFALIIFTLTHTDTSYRYSGWPCVSHFPPGKTTTPHLLRVLRDLFATYGIPEEISLDGGPQFQHTYMGFLKKWGIDSRLSSVGYAQSNGQAEAGVKMIKRILTDSVLKDGSLNDNKVLAALLQYRNTPLLDVNLSPTQIPFHRQLKDAIPTHRNQYHLHREWVVASEERAQQYAKKNRVIADKYNQHTRSLDYRRGQWY